ncbi:MAG: neutral zinc metallopeptidase [Novosphingobium sp.]
MRLDEFDPNSIDVEDQRGSGGGGRFPLPIGGGKMGCGTLLIVIVAALVFKVDPSQLLSGMQGGSGGTMELPGQTSAQGGGSAAESCAVNQESRESCNALSSLNKTWGAIFVASKVEFARPKLVFYAQSGNSGCGAAQSAMGPFYCPTDNGIYLDTDFYRQMDQELGATGQFARDYVIAHEYGHHVQNLTGVSDQVHELQQRNPARANQLSVRLELQADCYAGIWAAKNKDRMDPGDMESGLNAAHQIGDDTLMKSAGRTPQEASFTHGSSAQRMQWLRKGLESGNEDACDTFADMRN